MRSGHARVFIAPMLAIVIASVVLSPSAVARADDGATPVSSVTAGELRDARMHLELTLSQMRARIARPRRAPVDA